MSDLLERIIDKNEPNAQRKERLNHPTGFQPGVISPSINKPGEIIADPLEASSGDEIDWDETMRAWGLNPAQWQIIEPIEFRFWDMAIGNGETKRMKYFKARFIKRVTAVVKSEDVDDLIKHVRSRARNKKRPEKKTDNVLIAAIADTQFGKDDGDGLKGTVSRFIGLKEKILDRARETNSSHLLLPSLGDIIENCDGFYAQQRYRVEANLRYQVKIAYESMVEIVTYLAPHFNTIRIPVIGGNHGENRDSFSGKSATDFSDNWDVELWDITDRIIHANTDAYDHVVITTPHSSLTQTIDVNGKILGLAHGHQFSRGSDAQKKAIEWLKGQSLAKTRMGDCDILLSGHFHHFQMIELARTEEGRLTTWIQTPAMDEGSDWFYNTTGLSAPPGMLTFTIDSDGSFGRDIKILE